MGDCFYLQTKMNWFMKRRSLKPSLTNLIKPLLKCRDTKKNIVNSENFMQLCMSLTPVILLFCKTTQYILFPNATFSIYVATNFFSNLTEKCQYYQQTKVQLNFYPFFDNKKIQFFLVIVFLVQRLNP